MAQVRVTAVVNLSVTDSEWRLIMRALAAYAGVKLKPKASEMKEAEALNKQLLGQRRSDLQEQLEVADAALKRAEQASEAAPVIDPNEIDRFQEEV